MAQKKLGPAPSILTKEYLDARKAIDLKDIKQQKANDKFANVMGGIFLFPFYIASGIGSATWKRKMIAEGKNPNVHKEIYSWDNGDGKPFIYSDIVVGKNVVIQSDSDSTDTYNIVEGLNMGAVCRMDHIGYYDSAEVGDIVYIINGNMYSKAKYSLDDELKGLCLPFDEAEAVEEAKKLWQSRREQYVSDWKKSLTRVQVCTSCGKKFKFLKKNGSCPKCKAVNEMELPSQDMIDEACKKPCYDIFQLDLSKPKPSYVYRICKTKEYSFPQK